MNKACAKCKEWRCKKAHCRCARQKAAAAAAAAAASSTPRTAAATSHETPAPVGRPAALDVKMLDIGAWWQQLVQDVGRASVLFLSSYMYDDKTLHDALLKQLRAGCEVCILIDKSAFDSGKPYEQRSRLAALEKLGAQVWLCRGPGRMGIHHKKAVVVDRRVAYVGGSNLTWKSRNNGEQSFRMAGPIVQDIVQDLESSKRLGEQWQPRA